MAWAQTRDIRRETSEDIAAGLRLDKIQCRKLLERTNWRGRVAQPLRALPLARQTISGGNWTPAQR